MSLSDCPFCGHEPFQPIYDDAPHACWFVVCDECQCEGPVADTEAGAVAAWNLRASQAKLVEENARYRHLLDECADELENTRNQSGLIADVRAALAEHGGQT